MIHKSRFTKSKIIFKIGNLPNPPPPQKKKKKKKKILSDNNSYNVGALEIHYFRTQ